MKTYCISLLKDVMKKLNTAADSLKEIAGGKGKGQGWKDPLRATSSWAKVTELWTQVLSKCDCKPLYEKLVSLKEDRRTNCMHAACNMVAIVYIQRAVHIYLFRTTIRLWSTPRCMMLCSRKSWTWKADVVLSHAAVPSTQPPAPN